MPTLVHKTVEDDQPSRHLSVGKPYRNDGNGFKNLKTVNNRF
jgi:hypothetical protein